MRFIYRLNNGVIPLTIQEQPTRVLVYCDRCLTEGQSLAMATAILKDSVILEGIKKRGFFLVRHKCLVYKVDLTVKIFRKIR